MSEKLTKLTTVSMRSSDHFGWSVTCYEEITKIEYWETEAGKRVIKHVFEITEGYDLQVFEEAIKQRKEFS